MQVTYQQRLEDWIAAQIFAVEQLSSLNRQDKKVLRNLLIYFFALDILIFLIGRADAFFWFFTAALVAGSIYLICKHSISKQRMICRRLLIAYGAEFEKEEDKTVTWDVSPECIVLRDRIKETRFRWDAVQKMVVCPDYLFIDFGGLTGWASFPGCAVVETQYQAFCEEVIRTYREHTARQRRIADVVHSEWAIDFEKLKRKATMQWSAKKVFFTVLWGIVFTIVGVLFLGAMSLGLSVAATFMDRDTEAFSRVLALALVLGSELLGVTGVILSALGKLPGTRVKNQ